MMTVEQRLRLNTILLVIALILTIILTIKVYRQ